MHLNQAQQHKVIALIKAEIKAYTARRAISFECVADRRPPKDPSEFRGFTAAKMDRNKWPSATVPHPLHNSTSRTIVLNKSAVGERRAPCGTPS